MKKQFLLSLLVGLAVVGCNRAKTDSGKVSSTDQTDSNKPAYQQPAAPTPAPAAAPAAAPAEASRSSSQVAASSSTLAPSTLSPGSTDPAPVASNANPPAEPAPIAPTAPAPMPRDAVAATEGLKDNSIATRIAEWKLSPDDIKSEVETNGSVTRSKTPGAGEPTGPMDDILVNIVTTRLKADPETSELKITVEAKEGAITLTGSAQSLEQIGRAMALSLDTGGVTQATSQLKLEKIQ